MKPSSLPRLFFAALSCAFFSTTGCAQKEKIAEAPSPSTMTATLPAASTVATEIAAANWADIKEDTFDQRVHFLAGMKQLDAKLDGQIAELVAKRATMKGTTRTEEWDFAMKEMNNSRSHLKSVVAELSQATPPTWAQRKDKVGLAWVRTQNAYGKVKASTTS